MARPAAATATLDHGLQGKLHFPEQPEEGGIAPGVPAAARAGRCLCAHLGGNTAGRRVEGRGKPSLEEGPGKPTRKKE